MNSLNMKPFPGKCLLGLILLMQFTGCGPAVQLPEFSESLVPVEGIITFQKKPLIGAAVTFFPTGSNAVRAAYGLTDESGKYQVMTPISGIAAEKSMGVVPGTYSVIISCLEMPDGSAVPKEMTTAEAIEKGAREILPPKYSNEQRSVLKAEVQPKTPRTDMNFDL